MTLGSHSTFLGLSFFASEMGGNDLSGPLSPLQVGPRVLGDRLLQEAWSTGPSWQSGHPVCHPEPCT